MINGKWVNVHKSCVEGSDAEPLHAELDRIFDQDDAA